VTTVYVIVDDFCKEHLPEQSKPGPASGLSRSEVITLAILAQWSRWGSERGFYRFAEECLRSAFPGLPDRTRYNRLARGERDTIAQLSRHLAASLRCRDECFEVIDCSAVPVRERRRRGNSWLLGDADIGKSTRLGWFYGFRLLLAVTAAGVISGYCFSAGSQNDRQLAEAFFALRASAPDAVASIGRPVPGVYLADKGFAGKKWLPRWLEAYHAAVIAQGQTQQWSRTLRRWLAHYRQIVETVFEKLHNVFALQKERPHRLDGFQMRLSAKVALHNICIAINRSLGRVDLATADLLGWS
jgi:hypothetical protein